MQSGEKRVFSGQGKYPLFDHCTVDVVVLNDGVLSENFDRKNFLGFDVLSQHHLVKGIDRFTFSLSSTINQRY